MSDQLSLDAILAQAEADEANAAAGCTTISTVETPPKGVAADQPPERARLTFDEVRRRLTASKVKEAADAAAGMAGVEAALAIVEEVKSSTPDHKPDVGFAEVAAEERAEAMERQHADANTCKDAADWLDEPDEPDNPLIHGLIEVGSLAAIVGPAKAAKSWLAEELAICIATGADFFGRRVKRQRVYYANVEISPRQFKKRLRSICKRLAIAPSDLRGWLSVENLRGHSATWKWCYDEARRRNAEAVVIDPFYQVFKGCETNEADCQAAVEEMKKFLAAGLTTIIVFHCPKGFSGDRQIVDMISGSSVLVRFPENVIAILPHATDKEARVVDCSVLRDYPPPDPFTVKFDDGALMLAPDIPPVLKSGVRTYKTAEQREAEKAQRLDAEQTKLRNCLDVILNAAGDNLLSVSQVKEKLAAKHIGKNRIEDFLRARLDGGELRKCAELVRGDNGEVKTKPRKKGGREFISTPDRIQAYEDKFNTLQVYTS